MSKPHKHSALIKAWADGAEIQYFNGYRCTWNDINTPVWDPKTQYRIKPDLSSATQRSSEKIFESAFTESIKMCGEEATFKTLQKLVNKLFLKKKAEVEELKLEFCPDKMSPMESKEYENAQRSVNA